MKTENVLCGLAMAVVLQLGILAASAQTNIYLYSGSETNITLPSGTYIITTYGASGGGWEHSSIGSLGAEMSAEFNFSTPMNLTLLVGGHGDIAATVYTYNGGGGGTGGDAMLTGFGNTGEGAAGGGYSGGGGGGGNSPDGGYGGGGSGSIIDSSAIAILGEVSGSRSPDAPYNGNGEIIITAVPTPLVITTSAAFGFTNGVFGFDLTGPYGSNVVIQASTDLQTWIPLQTNLLSGLLYFSDSQSTTNVQRFYRAQLSP